MQTNPIKNHSFPLRLSLSFVAKGQFSPIFRTSPPSRAGIRERKRPAPRIRKKPPSRNPGRGLWKRGGYLLSRLAGSTIGAGGLNFSVRDGKRWVPAAVGAFSLLAGGFPPGGCDCHEPGTNERRSRGPYGLLVPLGFAVAGFAPAAYRRRRLRRPSKEVSSRGGLRA